MRWVLIVVAAIAVALLATFAFDVWPFGPKYVRILASDGKPIMGAVLVLERPGAGGADFSGVTHSGDGWLEIPRGKIRDGATMRVTAPGCGIVTGELPPGNEIRLPAGRCITFLVPGDFPLPRPPISIDLEVRPDSETSAWDLALRQAVAPPDHRQLPEEEREPPGHYRFRIHPGSRSVDMMLPRGGRWLVSWSVMVQSGDSAHGRGPGQPITLEIPDGATEVELPVTEGLIRKYWRAGR